MDLTTRGKERIGGINIHKGKAKDSDVNLVTWDAVPNCDPEECPIADNCPYNKSGKCTLRQNYQKHVVDTVLKSFDSVSEEQMLKIGMHLIPLYSQLIEMKIVALDAPKMVVNRGSLAPHPVFKEIRLIIREISACLRDIGVGGNHLGRGIPPSHNPEKGELGYYEEMLEN
jgi:hypothetical protein